MSEDKGQNRMMSMRINLAFRCALDDRMDKLVRRAGKVVNLLRDEKTMEESQIRNLLDVALSTRSLEVVTNFVRYQMGRTKEDSGWRHNGFGRAVIREIEESEGIVRQLAREVADEVCPTVKDAEPGHIENEARRELMRLFLGYLNRWFCYGRKTDFWDDIAAATER